MIRKGQVKGVGKGDINGQVSFIASLLEWRSKPNKNGDPLGIVFLCEFLQHNRFDKEATVCS